MFGSAELQKLKKNGTIAYLVCNIYVRIAEELKGNAIPSDVS
jgi:hypothetical protein